MNSTAAASDGSGFAVVSAEGELPEFGIGEKVLVDVRAPVGHYRVPLYLRGKIGRVETVIEPSLVDNEAEGFGRNAGSRMHYYRLAFPIHEIWPGYTGSQRDGLRIEVAESWLQRA
jgi:nitrile hydratase